MAKRKLTDRLDESPGILDLLILALGVAVFCLAFATLARAHGEDAWMMNSVWGQSVISYNRRAAPVLEAPGATLTSPTYVEVKMATPNKTEKQRARKPLTMERLREVFTYDPISGEFTNLVNYGRRKAGTRAGTKAQNGYRYILIDYRSYLEHRVAWFCMTGAWPENDVDHINRVRDDNRFANLRAATRQQNLWNAKLRSGKTTTLKGVTFDKGANSWKAQIRIGGKNRHLGRFKTAEAAAVAYRRSAEQHFGEFFFDGE